MIQPTHAVLGEEAVCNGSISASDLTILGRFEGALTLTGCGRTGERSSIRGEIAAREVTVGGEFEGTIRATRLVFGRLARARGQFHADRISIEEGACVDGRFNLETGGLAEAEEEAAVQDTATPLEAAGTEEEASAAPEAPVEAATDPPGADADPRAADATA